MDVPIKGIDVSKYQGNIDWVKVRAEGVRFAFVRVGWCHYDGSIELDSKYHENMKAANAAGIDVGVYLYSYADGEAGMERAAQEALALCKPYKVSCPVVLDIEETTDTVYTKRKKAENSALCRSFLNSVEKAGYFSMLYTYTYFANTYLDMARLTPYALWIADYRGKLGYKGAYGIWQYSSKGAVAGISGNVDMNWAYQDYAARIREQGMNGLMEPISPPPASSGQWKVETGPFKDALKLERARNIYLLAGYEAFSMETAAGDGMKVQIPGLSKDKANQLAEGMQALTGWQTYAYPM